MKKILRRCIDPAEMPHWWFVLSPNIIGTLVGILIFILLQHLLS